MRALLSIGRLLLAAEKSGTGSSAALLVRQREGGPALGQIFVEGGRLRWAIADGFTTRLLSGLAQEAGLGLDEVRYRLLESVELGGALEESLLEIAGLPEDRVRQAFLRHTASVAAFLASKLDGGAALVYLPKEAPPAGTTARLTFSPLEILAEACAFEPAFATGLPPLPPVFLEQGPDHSFALCFLELRDPFLPALPVSAFGRLEGGLLPALDLYRQAQRLRRGLFANDESSGPFAGILRAGDRGWAVTSEPPFLSVFRLSETGETGRILSRFRLGRAASVAQERLPLGGATPPSV